MKHRFPRRALPWLAWSWLLLWSWSAWSAPPYQQSPPPGIAWGWQAEVFFALNSAELQARDLPLLQQIAADLVRYPELSLLLTGHTDNTGDLGYNAALSARRSGAVATYLVKQGVDPDRILKRAVGEQRPVASDRCDRDRQRNRRVDLAFYPTGEDPPPPPETGSLDSKPDRSTKDPSCP
jgi:outer membrane protein OmpA-like peptidoglycan-associated protein